MASELKGNKEVTSLHLAFASNFAKKNVSMYDIRGNTFGYTVFHRSVLWFWTEVGTGNPNLY